MVAFKLGQVSQMAITIQKRLMFRLLFEHESAIKYLGHTAF